SSGTKAYRRDGASVAAGVLADGAATYTPGVSEKRAGTSRFLHSGLKNADSQTTAAQTIEHTNDFDAYGNGLGTPSGFIGPFKYGGGYGYQEDQDHGLKLLGHRYYDSSTGRFLSRDPAFSGRNWTSYCANNPLRRADPRGLDFDWNRYWSDVGKVFQGYGCALDPRNLVKGVVALGEVIGNEGVGAGGKALLDGLGEMVNGVFQLDDPERFGEALMNVIITASSSAGVAKGASAAVKMSKAARAARAAAALTASKIAQALRSIEAFLGKGFTHKINKAGDIILMSADGKKKVRLDINKTKPHQSVHVDIEIWNEKTGKFENVGKAYPNDVPKH
ncbi:MAG: RHS repeat-associated core domain-containing protein, partial [Fimbriimonadaceae bacterium]